MKLAIHFHPVPKSRMVEIYLHSPIRLHGVVLNEISIWTTLLFKANTKNLIRTLIANITQNAFYRVIGVTVLLCERGNSVTT